MILILNGTHEGTNWTNFMLSVIDYTSAFDRVASYVANGLVLENATLIEGGNRMELPIEAFDGQSFSGQFDKIQQQWEAIFDDRPLPLATLDKQRFVNWNRRLIDYYDQQINHTIKSILRLSKKLKRISSPPASAAKQEMAKQYSQLLKRRYIRIASLEASRQNAIAYLKEIESNTT
ncbi:hypothetical protein GCM10028803_40150 [Larkinella knui]|uniref:Uncharacterized protein n=1 Tax=Larkinella knui TaxID=2025310 RepID=A0A3P1CG39_9BACT|nr:hypothetical protein [Larkinella knui]RRB11854.1 hypothetical protein EHT87_25655 [Larkinella knui]